MMAQKHKRTVITSQILASKQFHFNPNTISHLCTKLYRGEHVVFIESILWCHHPNLRLVIYLKLKQHKQICVRQKQAQIKHKQDHFRSIWSKRVLAELWVTCKITSNIPNSTEKQNNYFTHRAGWGRQNSKLKRSNPWRRRRRIRRRRRRRKRRTSSSSKEYQEPLL